MEVGRADSLATDVGNSDSNARARSCRHPGVADGIEQDNMAEDKPGWSPSSWLRSLSGPSMADQP
jgi:hypothetical protein